MKKKIIIMISVLMVSIIGIVLMITKGDWNEAMNCYGVLNLMEVDDISVVNKNESCHKFEINSTKDFYVTGFIKLESGNATCKITLDGNVIYEKYMESGYYKIETDLLKNKTGEVMIQILASDDVDGSYNISVNTRESKINVLVRRVKEYI